MNALQWLGALGAVVFLFAIPAAPIEALAAVLVCLLVFAAGRMVAG